jgi:hypothetical protein
LVVTFDNEGNSDQEFINLGALNVIEQCLNHLDDRVISLVLRITGLLITKSAERFALVESAHPNILTCLLTSLRHKNDALIFGAVEALSSIVTSPLCVAWLSSSEALISIINLLECGNLFVVQACCRLISNIVNLSANSPAHYEPIYKTMLTYGNLAVKLKKMLAGSESSNSKMTALELLWQTSKDKIFTHKHGLVFIF